MTATDAQLCRLNALVNQQSQASRCTPLHDMMTRAAEIDALRVIVAAGLLLDETWPGELVDNEPGR